MVSKQSFLQYMRAMENLSVMVDENRQWGEYSSYQGQEECFNQWDWLEFFPLSNWNWLSSQESSTEMAYWLIYADISYLVLLLFQLWSRLEK